MSGYLPLDHDGAIRRYAILCCLIVSAVAIIGTAVLLWVR